MIKYMIRFYAVAMVAGGGFFILAGAWSLINELGETNLAIAGILFGLAAGLCGGVLNLILNALARRRLKNLRKP